MEIRSKKEWVYLKLGMQDSKGSRSVDPPNSTIFLHENVKIFLKHFYRCSPTWICSFSPLDDFNSTFLFILISPPNLRFVLQNIVTNNKICNSKRKLYNIKAIVLGLPLKKHFFKVISWILSHYYSGMASLKLSIVLEALSINFEIFLY